MARIRSFPPIAGESAHTLILGTMPGAASLAAREYYAHPRNAFWSILGHLVGFDPKLEYRLRTQRLIDAGVAVWDVLRSCERHGSLDAAIDRTSLVANDFARFFDRHPHVDRVFFNGGSAEALYRRHVLPTLSNTHIVSYRRLPSTSPANASLAAATKAEKWRVAIAPAGVPYAAVKMACTGDAMPDRRKELIRAYKETPRPFGVYRVHNTVNGKSLVGVSRDMRARLNRHEAELSLGIHPNKALLADWKELGKGAFAFEMLDTLEPSDRPGYDPKDDLEVLEALWLDKLQPYDDAGYNERGKRV